MILFSVTPSSPKTLIDFLSQKLDESWSKKKIKWAIEHHLVRVNHFITTSANAQLKNKDKITFFVKAMPSELSFPFKKEILFENEALIIINKPPFHLSESDLIKKALHPHSSNSIHLVHRLDKGSTGALIFAKSQAIKEDMIQLFRERKVNKHYLALCEGKPAQQKGSIKNTLGTVGIKQGQAYQGLLDPPKGKVAISHYELKLQTPTCCLMQVNIPTGRTHQIRVHLSQLKCPIIGDARYGKKFFTPYPALRPLLHAHKLSFNYQGENIQVLAPLPKDFKSLLKTLRKHPQVKDYLNVQEKSYLD